MRLLDLLTFGITAKNRAADERLKRATDALQAIHDLPPRTVFVEPFSTADKKYQGAIACIAKDDHWQWFVWQMREKFLRQAIDGIRAQKGDRDIYLGSIIGLDLLLTEMQRLRAAYEEQANAGGHNTDI